jgi:hypothetical protein
MQEDSSKAADKAVRELLIPSRICEVKLRNEWPEIFFENAELDIESGLWLNSEWRIEPELPVLQLLTERQREMVLLGELAGDEVHDIQCLPDGGLIVDLASKRRLVIVGVPNDPSIAEPWILSELGRATTAGAAKIVALAHEGFAVWPREPPAKSCKDSAQGEDRQRTRNAQAT